MGAAFGRECISEPEVKSLSLDWVGGSLDVHRVCSGMWHRKKDGMLR